MSYNVIPSLIEQKDSEINLTLSLLTTQVDSIQAQSITARLSFYEGNIMRLQLNEEAGYENRFSISSEEDFAVVEAQLKPTIPTVIKTDSSWKVTTGKDSDYFLIQF